MATQTDKAMELVFFTYAEMEQFSLTEMADREYMANKLDIWLECGFITQYEYGYMQANWGEPGREAA